MPETEGKIKRNDYRQNGENQRKKENGRMIKTSEEKGVRKEVCLRKSEREEVGVI